MSQSPENPTTQNPLKPGRVYGIIALLCGLEPIACLGVMFLGNCGILTSMHERSLFPVFLILFLISYLCIPAGILFGILGRNTQGRLYAIIGLLLSVLYLTFMIVVFHEIATNSILNVG